MSSSMPRGEVQILSFHSPCYFRGLVCLEDPPGSLAAPKTVLENCRSVWYVLGPRCNVFPPPQCLVPSKSLENAFWIPFCISPKGPTLV